jgi:hypothetical protein
MLRHMAGLPDLVARGKLRATFYDVITAKRKLHRLAIIGIDRSRFVQYSIGETKKENSWHRAVETAGLVRKRFGLRRASGRRRERT